MVGGGGGGRNMRNMKKCIFVHDIMHQIQPILVSASKTPRAMMVIPLAERNRRHDYCFGELVVTVVSLCVPVPPIMVPTHSYVFYA